MAGADKIQQKPKSSYKHGCVQSSSSQTTPPPIAREVPVALVALSWAFNVRELRSTNESVEFAPAKEKWLLHTNM